ncbi:glycosyltransferase family 4 protein [Sulfodiicoccus acidiphilus]|nr:glycosyltransferase family 4 protein [Sulfodiicoccus acidiphilus]
MRVSMVTPLFIPVRGGTEVHVYNLSKWLVRMGDQVTVHTTRDTYESRRSLPRVDEIEGIKVIRRNRIWRTSDPIVHLHNLGKLRSTWNLYTTFVLTLGLRKVVFTPHHSLTIDRGRGATLAARLMMRGVKVVIAVSDWEKEEMVRRGVPSYKIRVIPNGVEDEAFTFPRERTSTSRPYLLFLARIYRAKRQDVAIEALQHLPEVELVVAGQVQDREYLQSLKRRASELGLAERVKFVIDVDQRTKYTLIDSSLAVVLTSEVEADGLAIKEAMARGKPVIVSNKAALPYLVGPENGFVVSDPTELAEAASKLLHNERLVAEMGENNAKKALEWKWEAVAKRVRALYGELES